jgi:hypothetical protein
MSFNKGHPVLIIKETTNLIYPSSFPTEISFSLTIYSLFLITEPVALIYKLILKIDPRQEAGHKTEQEEHQDQGRM